VLARSAGALFIRSFERGERVHLAMLSRGYDGTLPLLFDETPGRGAWARAAVLPVAAFVVAVGSWWVG
jgi:cobalt/nickel transport system permease protein